MHTPRMPGAQPLPWARCTAVSTQRLTPSRSRPALISLSGRLNWQLTFSLPPPLNMAWICVGPLSGRKCTWGTCRPVLSPVLRPLKVSTQFWRRMPSLLSWRKAFSTASLISKAHESGRPLTTTKGAPVSWQIGSCFSAEAALLWRMMPRVSSAMLPALSQLQASSRAKLTSGGSSVAVRLNSR
ncbi:MAG: hypothetical protein BWY87_01086 [Deltaproteobacteria bacterium ADurb.Bin510]|nr:MAG: hypothetical protein BWY87_01086 [Deltaproteobacteria bacterium ADurb.Bin510]